MIKFSEVNIIQPTPLTQWIFVRVWDEEGTIGLGECSFSGAIAEVAGAAKYFLKKLTQSKTKLNSSDQTIFKPNDEITAAAYAGVNQAIADLIARRNNISLAKHLGDPLREKLSFYANINRSIIDRTPRSFADAAARARRQDVQAVKIAPFDSITPEMCESGNSEELILAGLDRIAAVKDILGNTPLMVDCHWRFDVETASLLIDQVKEFSLEWLECPIPETSKNLIALSTLRRKANSTGMKLAGGEQVWSLHQVNSLISHSAYDVIMPDVKYTGSLATFIAMGRTIEAAGIEFSPHNPTGPIAHAMTMEACTLFKNTGRIEYQHAETPLFDSIVGYGLPPIKNGVTTLNPNRRGLGLSLDVPALCTAENLAVAH